jgi:hypothetical protein
MGGTTANGWPYVTPTDKPKEFPAASQALANKLQARLGAQAFQSGGGATDVNGNLVITFATAFATAPVVLAMCQAGVPRFVTLFTAPTTTGVTLRAWSDAGAPIAATYIFWLALGTSATAGT